MASVVVSGSLGYPGESEAPPARLVATSGTTNASLCVSTGVELSASLPQKMLGGGSTAKALYPSVEDNLLVPWFLGDSVLDREELKGPVVEVLSPIVNKLFVELCFVRIEKDGGFCFSTTDNFAWVGTSGLCGGRAYSIGLELSLGGWRLWWVSGSR
jgi:hypothetical protein